MDKEKMAAAIQRQFQDRAPVDALVCIIESIQRETLEEVRKLAGEIGKRYDQWGSQTNFSEIDVQIRFADKCMETILRPKDYLDTTEFWAAMTDYRHADSSQQDFENVKRLIRKNFGREK